MEDAIGVIDSGVGGLTVTHELIRQLPKERLIYLGDTLRCPYGPRTKEEVRQFTWEMVDFLLKKNIKMLVIACNTATAFTLTELQENLTIPVIGVIQPGARAAIKVTTNGKVGVIGTEGTINSRAYPEALQEIRSDVQFCTQACPMFVPMVEQGMVAGKKVKRIVESALKPMREMKRMDTLILGCTHYPLLRETIQDVMGEQVTIISSSEETAREASAVLAFRKALYNGERIPEHQFYATGELETFRGIAEDIFKTAASFEAVSIEKAVIC